MLKKIRKIYSDFAMKTAVYVKHAGAIVKFTAIIRRAENCYQFTICEKFIPVMDNLKTSREKVNQNEKIVQKF